MSWRYWRSHAMAAARGMVGFSVFMGWMLGWMSLTYMNAVVFRANPLWRFGSLAQFGYVIGTLLVAAVVWWICVTRLARSVAPEARVHG